MTGCVTYVKLLIWIMVSGRKIHNLLDFIAGSVRVFPKDDVLTLSGGRESHKGVTGGGVHVCHLPAGRYKKYTAMK